jgi:hypothetical protein
VAGTPTTTTNATIRASALGGTVQVRVKYQKFYVDPAT